MGTQESAVLYEVDIDTNEAVGVVHFFCGDDCRSQAQIVTAENVKLVPGDEQLINLPGGMICETCSKPLDDVLDKYAQMIGLAINEVDEDTVDIDAFVDAFLVVDGHGDVGVYQLQQHIDPDGAKTPSGYVRTNRTRALSELQGEALDILFAAWSPQLMLDIGRHLSCNEAAALADVCKEFGLSEHREALMFGHIDGDEDDEAMAHGALDPSSSDFDPRNRLWQALPIEERYKRFEMAQTATVLQRGWGATGVFPVEGGDLDYHFGYTFGLSLRGLPELVVVGFSTQAAPILDNVATMLIEGRTGEPGEPFVFNENDGGFEMVLVPVPDEWRLKNMTSTRTQCGDDFTALQIVFQDDEHRWPWHPQHRANADPEASPIPVLDDTFLSGRCRYCLKPIVSNDDLPPLQRQTSWRHADGSGAGASVLTKAMWCEGVAGYVKVEPVA